MNYKTFGGLLAVLVLFTGVGAFAFVGVAQGEGENASNRKIVVFKEGVSDSEKDAVLGALSQNRIKRLTRALSADVLENADASKLGELAKNPKVKRIDNDVIVYALSRTEELAKGGSQVGVAAAQVLPWGIDRIDAELVWLTGNSANPIKVGVIDTGISLSHPDLASNIKGSYNAISTKRSANDDNGHGSHVAGIVAALNNTAGVVGGAPQADLYAIKALSASGSGYLSDVIESIDWAIFKKLNVINMSLGTTADVQSFHDAVIRANNAGITVVAAAGNSGGAVNYPGAYNEVIGVSATDSTNTIASWSSRGPEVDLAAPGVSIYSTYKGSGYATLSGTSMASPHVAAAAALLMNRTIRPSEDANTNGKWEPAEIKARLQSTATDLGATGADPLYGAGLVNAFAAVQ
ncbi:MAG: S8 family peptidase [Patescibacteria group bacterium]